MIRPRLSELGGGGVKVGVQGLSRLLRAGGGGKGFR